MFCSRKKSQRKVIALSVSIQINGYLHRGPSLPKQLKRLAGYRLFFLFLPLHISPPCSLQSPFALSFCCRERHMGLLGNLWETKALVQQVCDQVFFLLPV